MQEDRWGTGGPLGNGRTVEMQDDRWDLGGPAQGVPCGDAVPTGEPPARTAPRRGGVGGEVSPCYSPVAGHPELLTASASSRSRFAGFWRHMTSISDAVKPAARYWSR
jgi:hypothetical protein